MLNNKRMRYDTGGVYMYHIAVVEDEREFADQLQEFLKRYEEEQDTKFKISIFADGSEILEDYQCVYDIILLDIEMPQVNGMEAAERIRMVDPDVVLIFITNMGSYAIRGYEVEALDFVMKPITYYGFAMKMTRALKRVRRKEQQQIVLTLSGGMKKLSIQQIYYIEVQNHMLHYHTSEGEYILRGTMQSVEEMMRPYPFVKCSHWYLVNLAHVSEVQKNKAIVGGHELEISRRNRTPFLKALTEYVGGIC